jgi:hypothetical protein
MAAWAERERIVLLLHGVRGLQLDNQTPVCYARRAPAVKMHRCHMQLVLCGG